MAFRRTARVFGGLSFLVFLGAQVAGAQSLAAVAEKEKERRKKAGADGAPAFSNDDLRKLPDSAEANPGKPGSESSRASSTSAASDADTRSEAWWRSQAQRRREAVAVAEKAVKSYETLIEEARTGLRQPQPGDATRQIQPSRIATDAERRGAEYNLALARKELAEAKKALDDLQDEARKKQILPGWLR